MDETPNTEANQTPQIETIKRYNISPLQALENLYKAARMAQLSADDHAILTESAISLKTAIEEMEK